MINELHRIVLLLMTCRTELPVNHGTSFSEFTVVKAPADSQRVAQLTCTLKLVLLYRVE